MLTGMATDLFPTESMNPLERKRSDEGSSEPAAFAGPVARSKYSYQPNALDAPKSPSVTNAVPRHRVAAQQLELYDIDE